MEKAAIVKKTVEVLTPLETGNVVEYMRHLTVKSALHSPWFVGVFSVIAFYAVVKRSKFVVSALFTAAALLMLVHYTMPTDQSELSVSSTLPFAFGGLAIGAVLIYFTFIKTE